MKQQCLLLENTPQPQLCTPAGLQLSLVLSGGPEWPSARRPPLCASSKECKPAPCLCAVPSVESDAWEGKVAAQCLLRKKGVELPHSSGFKKLRVEKCVLALSNLTQPLYSSSQDLPTDTEF